MEGLGEYFTSVTIIVMPILIILSLLNAEWMITGNSSLYPKGLDLALGSNLTNIPML